MPENSESMFTDSKGKWSRNMISSQVFLSSIWEWNPANQGINQNKETRNRTRNNKRTNGEKEIVYKESCAEQPMVTTWNINVLKLRITKGHKRGGKGIVKVFMSRFSQKWIYPV